MRNREQQSIKFDLSKYFTSHWRVSSSYPPVVIREHCLCARARERESEECFFSWGACVGVAMEEQFAEFRVELDETGSVYEQLRIIAANLDSFIRLMQAALMPIHHRSFTRTNFFSFLFLSFFAFPSSSSSSSSSSIYIYILTNNSFWKSILLWETNWFYSMLRLSSFPVFHFRSTVLCGCDAVSNAFEVSSIWK